MMSKTKLSELGTFKNGLNYNSSSTTFGGCKIVGIPDFTDKYIANLRCLHEVDNSIVSDDYLLKKDDILFVRSNGNKALVGRTMIIGDVDDRITYSGFCIRFRPNKNKIRPLFLLYLFKSPQFRKQFSKYQQTSINNLNQDILSSIELELPDIRTQELIVKCIHSITEKIEINQHINDNLQQQLKLLYDYWFTQFDFPDDNGKPYRSSGGAMVWNEQLKRNIPQNWKVGTVSDCVDKISTGLNPRDNFVLGNGNIRYITVKNLTATGSLDFSGCDMIDEDARAIVHRRSDISVGDILFASIAPLGRCYLIQQAPVDWDINESVFSIRSKTDTVTPEFMYLYFQSDNFIQKATNTSTGSIFKGIRINTLLDTALIVPELQVCKRFTDAVKPLLAEINNNSSETAKLTALRDWLLPMLMNGQATISD